MLEYLVKSLVDDPDSVVIEAIETEGQTKYQVMVSPDDIGKVIGKHGRIANAMRTVARASAMRDKHRIFVEIVPNT